MGKSPYERLQDWKAAQGIEASQPEELEKKGIMPQNGGNDTFWVKIYIKWFLIPINYPEVSATYVNSGFYCIYEADKGQVTKWPVHMVFRVIEEYVPFNGE